MELWLEHQETTFGKRSLKVVIWLKNRKYQLVIKREIIKASGGFYVARLSSEQYGRCDNPNYIGDIFKYRKVQSQQSHLPSVLNMLVKDTCS